MYAPTLDRPPTVRPDHHLDTELLLIIDEIDTWSIEDLSAYPCGGGSCCYCSPDPTTGTVVVHA